MVRQAEASRRWAPRPFAFGLQFAGLGGRPAAISDFGLTGSKRLDFAAAALSRPSTAICVRREAAPRQDDRTKTTPNK
jgi:hypothetical protein